MCSAKPHLNRSNKWCLYLGGHINGSETKIQAQIRNNKKAPFGGNETDFFHFFIQIKLQLHIVSFKLITLGSHSSETILPFFIAMLELGYWNAFSWSDSCLIILQCLKFYDAQFSEVPPWAQKILLYRKRPLRLIAEIRQITSCVLYFQK